jgi:hypothetical protein
VPDDHSLCFAERTDQGDHIADVVKDGVGFDVGRRRRAAEAAHVGRDHMKAGRSQR